jgi:hypothetical protein
MIWKPSNITMNYKNQKKGLNIIGLTFSACMRIIGRLVKPHSGHVILLSPGFHFSTVKKKKQENWNLSIDNRKLFP